MGGTEETVSSLYVALLRGINVGGANKVPMAGLRTMAEGLGWRDVRTYIASGNLIFRAPLGDHAGHMRAALAREMGMDVPVLVLPAAELRAVLAACPFVPEDGRQAHVFFCFEAPALNREALEIWRAPSEVLAAEGRAVYLFAPEGIGRSKLAERMHKVITGTDFTARNLRTVRALVEMMDSAAGG